MEPLTPHAAPDPAAPSVSTDPHLSRGTAGSSGLTVLEVPQSHRYEASVDGRRVGLATYRLDGGTVVFPHTEVEPEFEGRGIASAIARAALDDARARGLRVVPACSFFRTYITRHPEYAELLA